MKTLEQIINDQISLLEDRYARSVKIYIEDPTKHGKEFWKKHAYTLEQFILLEKKLKQNELADK